MVHVHARSRIITHHVRACGECPCVLWGACACACAGARIHVQFLSPLLRKPPPTRAILSPHLLIYHHEHHVHPRDTTASDATVAPTTTSRRHTRFLLSYHEPILSTSFIAG